MKKNAARDASIFERWLGGDSQTELALAHGLTPPRIWQILRNAMWTRHLNAKQCAVKHAVAGRARGLKNVRDTYQGMDYFNRLRQLD